MIFVMTKNVLRGQVESNAPELWKVHTIFHIDITFHIVMYFHTYYLLLYLQYLTQNCGDSRSAYDLDIPQLRIKYFLIFMQAFTRCIFIILGENMLIFQVLILSHTYC